MTTRRKYGLPGLLLLCLLLGMRSLPAYASDDPRIPKLLPPIVDPLVKSDTPSVSLPFFMAGRLIVVQATVDSLTGNFILDTGAPHLVLNATYFRHYPAETVQDEQEIGITGRSDLVARTSLGHFQLGTIHYYRAQADLVNLGHIEDMRKIRILGLLGISMFKETELIIDYKNQLIHLRHIRKHERKTYQHAMFASSVPMITFDFDLKYDRILLKTEVGNKKLNFVVDYAAETNILDSRLPDRILDSITINGRVLLTGTGQQKVEAVTGDLSSFAFGELEVKNMPVILANLEKTCFGLDQCINGVLGYEFLSRYTIVFNFAKKKLYVIL